jgi:hypothetical protein
MLRTRPDLGLGLPKWREIGVLILPGATLMLEGVTHETFRDLLLGKCSLRSTTTCAPGPR